jgi:hypothetical protein
MLHPRIEDRADRADYQKAVARARATNRTPPARYCVRWRDETGTHRSLSLPTRCLALAAQSHIANGAGTLTLDRLVDLWSSAPLASAGPSSPRTPIRRSLDLHVLPRLGARQALTISRADVERLISTLHSKCRLSATTINKVLATLKRALEFGVQHGYLPSNPALGVRPIRRRSTRRATEQKWGSGPYAPRSKSCLHSVRASR